MSTANLKYNDPKYMGLFKGLNNLMDEFFVKQLGLTPSSAEYSTRYDAMLAMLRAMTNVIQSNRALEDIKTANLFGWSFQAYHPQGDGFIERPFSSGKFMMDILITVGHDMSKEEYNMLMSGKLPHWAGHMRAVIDPSNQACALVDFYPVGIIAQSITRADSDSLIWVDNGEKHKYLNS